MSKLYNGGAGFGFSLNFNTAVPVDTRFVVPTVSDLLNPQTWISGTYDSVNDTNNVYVVYPGLHVIVMSEKTIYVFGENTVNGGTLSNTSSWTRIATGGDADKVKELVEKAIQAVGLGATGEKGTSTGNYISGATTVEGEISALDTALKTIDDKVVAEKKAREEAIAGLDADFEKKDANEFITLKLTQTDGKISKVEVLTSDIASKSGIEEKLTRSATLKNGTESWEIQAALKYVAAGSGIPAHIALVDKNNVELSTIGVSDIIGNGVISSTSYNSTTGKLTLSFNQADGTTKDTIIDLSKMLDIDDVLISTDSREYLSVDLSGQEQSQAVFKALIVKMAQASSSNTGLADAYDVKNYIDTVAAGLEVTAQGDSYVTAAKDATDKKKIVVTTNIGNLTIGKSGSADTTLTGTQRTLVDGSEVASKVGSFVNARITEEVEKLDSTKASTGGAKVGVEITQTNGKISGVTVTETDIASAALLGTIADDKTKNTAFGKVAAEKEAREAAISNLKANSTTKDSKEYVKTTISQTAGIVNNEKVEVTYGSFTSGTNGIATVEEVKQNVRFEKGTGSNSAILKGTGVTAINEGEVAFGKYNNSVTHASDESAKTIFSIGNGSSASDLHNAMEVRENGDVWINLGSDYKKLQTILSNEIDWYEGQ